MVSANSDPMPRLTPAKSLTWRLDAPSARTLEGRHCAVAGLGRPRTIHNQGPRGLRAAGPVALPGILLASLLQPLLEVLLVFLLQLGVLGRSVDLARLVPAFVELLASPLVVDVHLVGVVDDLLDEGGGDEVDPLGVAEDQVSRHDRGLADAHG